MTYGQHRRAVRRVRGKPRKLASARFSSSPKAPWRALKREIGARQARKARKENRQRERIEGGRATPKDLVVWHCKGAGWDGITALRQAALGVAQ